MNNIKVYIVNGFPESGKTTFEDKTIELLKECKIHGFRFSTIDGVKELAKEIGWNGVKNDKSRKFLSDLKDLLTEYNDYPVKHLKKSIIKAIYGTKKNPKNISNAVVFIDCREPKEIKKLVKEFKAKTICVRRPEVEKGSYSNHADANILDYNYDYYIWNKGTIEELENSIMEFINSEIIGG